MHKHTILVVDDQPSNLEIIIDYLEESIEEYRIFHAINGKTACEIAESRHPDLIIMDWEMPVMSGIEAVEYLKSRETTREIPIIMATGVMTSSQHLQIALNAGASDYVRKPIDKIELIARVNSMLQLSDSHKAIKNLNSELETQKDRIEKAYHNIQKLSDMGKNITASLSLSTIIGRVYENINLLMHADAFGIGIYNPEKKRLEFENARELDQTLPPFYNYLHEADRLAVLCFLNQKEFLIQNFSQQHKHYISKIPAPKAGKNAQSFIYLPLNFKEKNIGVISVQSFTAYAYQEHHLDLLKNLAAYIAIALENASAYKQIAQQKEKLGHLNATKDKMFSIIGHDLRGPIGNFKSMLDLMINHSEYFDDAKRTEMLNMMKQSAGMTHGLLENLLYWAKTQRNEVHFEPQHVELNDIVESTLALLNTTAQDKSLQLSYQAPNNLRVWADKHMITTVLRNLITNAIKFTHSGGKVEVKANKTSHGTEISISDTGIGIAQENISKIFNINAHFTTQGTNSERGSGLGLLLCKEFVEYHGGKIHVESTQGKGSTFQFCIPAKQKTAE